jgi:hypothetical protein
MQTISRKDFKSVINNKMTMQEKHKEYYDRLSKLQGKYLNYFVAGFVDGESSFSVAMTRQKYPSLSKGWKWILNPVFNVYQHENNKDILILLKDKVFRTGRIHRKTSPYNVFTYSVENNKTLHEKIVPFFNKYQLATKTEDFKKFSKIVGFRGAEEPRRKYLRYHRAGRPGTRPHGVCALRFDGRRNGVGRRQCMKIISSSQVSKITRKRSPHA